MMTVAWWHAILQRVDHKKFPKRAEQIWDRHVADQSLEAMKMMVLAMADNTEEARKMINGTVN